MVDRKALGDVAAAGLAGDDRRREPDGVHEGGHVGREVLRPVTALGTVGVAVTALVSAKAWTSAGRWGSNGLKKRHESA